MKSVLDGAFINPKKTQSHEVLIAMETIFHTTFTLHHYSKTDSVRAELSVVTKKLLKKIVHEVFPVFGRHLATATNPAHRALWIRLDFNQWLSKTTSTS